MQGKPNRTLVRCFSRLLRLLCVSLLSVQSAAAQITAARAPSPVEVPESVVLVLKLVSATHVRPTTGVVISNHGLVLVPADFVAAGDEIVVMDGGTDVIRNGRPSRTVKRSLADGLAVLSVERLARPGIILSQSKLLQGHVFHLSAFPPAEKMAQGAQPLWVPVKLVKSDSDGVFTVSADTPLPNTTGPIIDNCGYLVGLNLATGKQSLAVDKSPVTIFGDDLTRVFDSMQISLPRDICWKTAQGESAQPTRQPKQDTAVADRIASPDEQVAPSNDAGMALPKGAVLNQAASHVAAGNGSAARLGMIPNWLWITGAAILIVLLAKFVFFSRLAKNDPQQAVERQVALPGPPSSGEPATLPLDSGAGSCSRNSAVKLSDEDGIPDVNALPDGFDGIVVIEGLLGGGTGFKRFCVVNTAHIDVVIGRGDADIRIETPAISRRHARLENDTGSLTITDLGSSNGTFIRGIPCLPTEIMMVDPEDEILLGDVRFRISMLTAHGEPK